MKQSKQIFFSVLALLLFLSSCKDKSSLLVNTWTVTDLKYNTEVPPEMQAQIQNDIAKMKQTFRLTYNADGTYLSRAGDQTIKGKWKLNWNSSAITSTPVNGSAKDFKILELTAKSFSFEADENGSKVIFVMIPAAK